MIAVLPSHASAMRRCTGWSTAAVSVTAPATLAAISAAWPEAPSSAHAVPLDIANPVSVASAFPQCPQVHDPIACMLTAPRWRARLGRHARCLLAERRLRPEVRVPSASRAAAATVAVIAVRAHDRALRQITVSLVPARDRWLVDATTPVEGR
ncbi:hypothetical protein [Saccharothrix longispora]|uniref:hypothetical protein n=1 Tax=Saccharothrix longispora TaxID=33920 RepID=UPI0028FDA22F|nr:hypothetical protein [Saccharothrix longispora]MDU0293318.1 hypothetical protein [Saccharothrix longispora]